MRHHIARTLAAAAFSVAAFAATTTFAGPFERHDDLSDRVDERMERMTERLDLSEEQRRQIQTIVEEQHAERDRLKAETQRRIDEVLNDAQRAKRDELMTERMDRRLDRLAERLDLSGDQEERIRTILAERKDNPDLTRSEIKERIAAVLTDEQKGRFEAMSERRGHHGPGGRFGGPCGDRGERGGFGGPDPAF